MDAEARAQTEARVFKVAVENIMPLWPQLQPLLALILPMMQTHNEEDIRKILLGQMGHLWIQWSDRVEALVVSEFAAYPRGVWVRAWLAAAYPGAKFNGDAFFSALSDWAVAHRCRGLEGGGRIGWLRKFPNARMEGFHARINLAEGAV